MKVFLMLLVLAIAGISGISQSYANSLIFCSDADKAYIAPDQVTVSPDGIFVLVEGEMIQVQAILQDNKGIYYLKPSIYWTCRKCGYSKNPAWTNYCQSCKRHYNA
jgi:hypothetical protein